MMLGVSLLLEVTFGEFIENFVGTQRFRYLCILLEVGLIWQTDDK